MALLTQPHLLRCILAPEVGELLLGNFHLLSAIQESIALAQFFRNDLEFSLRAACELVHGTDTFAPASANPGVANSDIKGIVADRYNGAFNLFVAHLITPVIQVVHANTLPRLYQRSSSCCRRKGRAYEDLVVRNALVISHPIPLEALLVGITGRD